MKPETRAKIQEALETAKELVEEKGCSPYALKWYYDAKDALAAEPDEPKQPLEPSFKIYKDCYQFMAVTGGFKSLQESVLGFGKTPIEALKALIMPDEPTVSKSVEELVDRLADGIWLHNMPREDAIVIVQQFLDTHIAERDKRIESMCQRKGTKT